MDILYKAAESNLTLAFTTAVVLLGFIALAKELQVYRRSRVLQTIIDQHLGSATQQRLLQDTSQLDALQRALRDAGFTHFADQVREFTESTHTPSHTPGSPPRLFNAFQASEFFEIDRFREDIGATKGFLRMLPPPLVDAVPGIMTSIGILGTFLGILYGIGESQTGDPSQPIDIQVLLAGMNVSFITSVFGLSGSIIVTVVSRLVDAEADSVMSDFILALDTAIERRTPQQVLEAILNQQEQSTAALQTLKHDLSDAIQTAMNNAFNQHLVPTFDRLEAHTAEMKDATLKLADGTASKQVDGVNALVQQVQSRLEDALGASMIAAGEQLAQFAETQATITQQWAEGALTLQTSVSGIQRAAAGQNQLAESMTETFDAATEAGQHFNAAARHISEASPQLRDAARHAEAMVGRVAETLQAFEEGQASTAKASGEQTRELFNSLQAQSAQIKDGFGSVTQDLSAAIEQLSGTLDTTASRLDASTQAVRESSEEAARTTRLTGRIMESQANLQGDVQAALKEATSVVTAASSAAERLTSMYRGMSQANERLEAHLSRLSEISNAQEEASENTLLAATQMKDTLETRIRDWRRTVDEFKDINGTLVSGMTTFANQFPSTIESNLKAFDKELAGALNRLNGSYNELQTTMVDFNDTFSDAARRLPRGR